MFLLLGRLFKCVGVKSVCVSWQEDVLVVTFFVTQEHGLLLQDSQPKPSTLLSLLALDTPYYYYICKVQTRTWLICVFMCTAVVFHRFMPFHFFYLLTLVIVVYLLRSYFGGEEFFFLM